jgi:hypothetical protein
MLDLTQQQELKQLIYKLREINQRKEVVYAEMFRLCIKHLSGESTDRTQRKQLVDMLNQTVERINKHHAQEQTEQAQACADQEAQPCGGGTIAQPQAQRGEA